MRSKHACVLLACLAIAGGCDWIGGEARPGYYRAAIEVPGGDLPFGLELTGEGPAQTVHLIDGTARLPVEKRTRRDAEVELLLPGGQGTLIFTTRGRHLRGKLQLGQASSFAFSAERDVTFRFFPKSHTDNADVAGRWSMVLKRAATTTEVVADLVQSHDRVAGILHEEDRDRALTGQILDEEVRLSAFDGVVAILLVARVDATGNLEGDYWSSTAGAAKLSAYRNPDAPVEAEPVSAPATIDIPLFRNY